MQPDQQQASPGTVADSTSLSQPGYLGAPATVQAPGAAAVGSQTYLAQPGQFDVGQLLQQWMKPGGAQAVDQVQAQNVGGLDPSLLSSLGSSQTIQALLQGFAPQAQRSTNNLNQTLANFGVTGGQNVAAQTELQAQLAAALSPSIASAIQNSQGNTLNAGEFGVTNSANNANRQLQAGTTNQGAQLTQNDLNAQIQAGNASQFNALMGGGVGQNAAFQQAANLTNAGAQNASSQFDAGAQNNMNQFNANQGFQGSQFNANALNQTNAANVGQFNQSQQMALNNMINAYMAQLGAFNSINQGGQQAGNQNAVNYGQDIQVSDPFGAILGAAKTAAPFLVGA